MDLSRIVYPTLVLNRKTAEKNITSMASRCSNAQVRFRPHFKTHQSHTVGSWFREAGISSITVSSALMAAYFIDDGWDDVTIAFPYNPREHDFLEYLAGRAAITLTIPGQDSARALSGKARSDFNVMIKVDTGYGRSGLLWSDIENARITADILSGNSNLTLTGLLTHAGNTYGAGNPENVISIYSESIIRMSYLKEMLGMSGIIISSGDTPSASLANDFTNIGELRPGNFVFFDLMQYAAGICSLDNIATAMACPVVDTSTARGSVVIHGGAVHLSKDSLIIDEKKVFGLAVKMTPEGWIPYSQPYYLTSVSQEHGVISMPPGVVRDFRPGDLVGIIPVHSCLTANLAGGYLLTDGSYADHMNSRKYSPSAGRLF